MFVARTALHRVVASTAARSARAMAPRAMARPLLARAMGTKMSHGMFCRQCEQTQDHTACVTTGVCGKTAETSATQDALISQIKSVAHWMVAAKEAGVPFETLKDIHIWTLAATFSTLTNVNFSSERICEYIQEGESHKAKLKGLVSTAPAQPGASIDLSGKSLEEMEEYGLTVSVPKRAEEMGHVDAFSLNEISTYGLKVRDRSIVLQIIILTNCFISGCLRVRHALCSIGHCRRASCQYNPRTLEQTRQPRSRCGWIVSVCHESR